MSRLTSVILAAGEGQDGTAQRARALFPLCGRPLISYLLPLARGIADCVVMVVGPDGRGLRAFAAPDVVVVEHTGRHGTGHALLSARTACPEAGPLLVLLPDVPLLTAETLERLVDRHRATAPAATVLTATLERPEGCGRLVRNAVDHDEHGREVTASGVYCLEAQHLWPALAELIAENDREKAHVRDVIPWLARAGARIETVAVGDPAEALRVNERRQLADAAAVLRRRILDRLMADGVTVIDPAATYVDVDVEVGVESVLYPGTHLEGRTRLGARCTVFPGVRIKDSTLADDVTVLDGALIVDSVIEAGETVPPRAHVEGRRPGAGPRVDLGRAVDPRLRRLLEAGARVPRPETVVVGPGVRLEQLDPRGLVLHPGTKIFGERTRILEGVELGAEEPVTLENAVLGRRVKVHGGFVKDSVLLDGGEARQGFHARDGCLLEETTSFAHNVGLKMTIVFPFGVLGSLINFCDCLLAGGTSRAQHSEVGSGFIHFNFTPRGDKATPSIFGDVPRGVMLDQAPVFLGGLAGVVGPARVGFGTVLAAGTVYRRTTTTAGSSSANRCAPAAPRSTRGA